MTSPTLAAMVLDSYSPRIFEGEIERRVFLTAPVDSGHPLQDFDHRFFEYFASELNKELFLAVPF